MAPRGSKRRGALQQAKEYLRINPGASNQQVVERLNVSLATVSAARSFLVQTGVIQRSFYDRSSPQKAPVSPGNPSPGSIVATTGVSDLEKEAAANAAVSDLTHGARGEPLTADDQRRRLSDAARRALIQGNDQLEIAAIQALARLDAASGSRDKLGPGAPLTDDDKIHRFSLLLQACGKRLTRKAWERAFGEQLGTQGTSAYRDEHRELGGSTQETPLPAPENGPPADESAGTPAEAGPDGD